MNLGPDLCELHALAGTMNLDYCRGDSFSSGAFLEIFGEKKKTVLKKLMEVK